MTGIAFYLFGSILAFIVGRYYFRSRSGDNYGWIEVALNTLFSCFSYPVLIAWGIIFLTSFISSQLSKINFKKPPRWL